MKVEILEKIKAHAAYNNMPSDAMESLQMILRCSSILLFQRTRRQKGVTKNCGDSVIIEVVFSPQNH